jgi:hypothetical protein
MMLPETPARKLARILVAHASRVAPVDRRGWLQGMISELDQVPTGAASLQWAMGCLFVSYMERVRMLGQSLRKLPRWLLILEMAICLVPMTWLFVAVLTTTVNGQFTVPAGLLYASATLVGPVACLVALWTIFRASSPVNRACTAILALLAVWAAAAYTAQLFHAGITVLQVWREYILIAVLPMLAAAHLMHIQSYRRHGH